MVSWCYCVIRVILIDVCNTGLNFCHAWPSKVVKIRVKKVHYVWLSQVELLSSKHTPVARKQGFCVRGANLTQVRAAVGERWRFCMPSIGPATAIEHGD